MKHLWEATRDLHHACEQHPVGAAMATGKPPLGWYAKWLRALIQIHTVIDENLPEEVHRCTRLETDLLATGFDLPVSHVATFYCDLLKGNQLRIDGAAYVLTGAHLMGGEIMRRRLEGYPTSHLEWDDRKKALVVLNTYRVRQDISQEARDCFAALLAIMDEIK